MYHCLAKRLLSSALSSTASFSTFLGGKEVLVAASHRRFASTGLEMNMSQITKTSSSFYRAAMPGQTLKLGDVVPNFSSDTTQGNIDFHSWIQVKKCQLYELALHFQFSGQLGYPILSPCWLHPSVYHWIGQVEEELSNKQIKRTLLPGCRCWAMISQSVEWSWSPWAVTRLERLA